MLFLPMASTVAGSGPRERHRNDERKRFRAVAFRGVLVQSFGGRRGSKPHFGTGRRRCEQEPILFIVLHTKSGSVISSLVRWQAGRISFHWRDRDRHSEEREQTGGLKAKSVQWWKCGRASCASRRRLDVS
jgi:hypothetical protein